MKLSPWFGLAAVMYGLTPLYFIAILLLHDEIPESLRATAEFAYYGTIGLLATGTIFCGLGILEVLDKSS